MNEGKKMETADFHIVGDINIELKLETTGEDHQELDGIDWYRYALDQNAEDVGSRTRK